MRYLIRNEFKKIFLKKTVYVFLISLAALYIVFALFSISTRNEMYGENWKEALRKSNSEVQKVLDNGYNYSINIQKSLSEGIIINEYMINNNINPNNTNYKNFVIDAKDLSPIIIIFLIIMFSTIVADEYSGGKIKLLLIRPYKRWKIVLSKWIVATVNSILIWGVSFLFSIIVGAIFFGNQKVELLKIINGIVVHQSQIDLILMQLWTLMLYSIGLGTFAFLFACITKTKTVSISVGLATYFFGGTIGIVLNKINLPLREYEFFTLLNSKNLMDVKSGDIIWDILIIFVYIICFVLLAMYFFQRNKKII